MKRAGKILLLMTLLAGVLLCGSVKAAAEYSGTCGDNASWVLDDEGTLTISGSGEVTELEWQYKKIIKKIVIKDGITVIGEHAFSFCDNLVSVILPDSLTRIERCAFYSSEKLSSIEIPKSVNYVGESALNDTASYANTENWHEDGYYLNDVLLSVDKQKKGRLIIKDGTRLIACRAFYETWSLRAVTVPNSVSNICNGAFYNSGITVAYYDGTEEEWEKVIVGEDNDVLLRNIANESNAISNSGTSGDNIGWTLNMSTGEMTIEGSGEVTSASWNSYKVSIEVVNIGDGITKIGKSVFNDCYNLRSVTLPESVTSIEEEAFCGCKSLKTINIPEKTVSIGNEAFKGCADLGEITLPAKLTSIGKEVFLNTAYYNDYNNWKDEMLYIDNCLVASRNTISGRCIIAENTYIIADRTFEYRNDLTDVTIPDSVKYIGESAFRKCGKLASVVISANVSEIKASTFYECTGLESITIPDNVRSIGNNAFYKCSGMKSVQFGKRVGTINERAFSGCSGLEKLVLPNSVTTIGDRAFSTCSGLKSVSVSTNVKEIKSHTFYGCDSLEEITLPFIGRKKNKNILLYEYNSYEAVFGYIFGYTYSQVDESYINQYADNGNFYWYKIPRSLRKVTITSEDVIPVCAFKGCSMLTDIVFTQSCYYGMNREAFRGCTNLKRVVLPAGIKYISDLAFNGCESLESINIPYTVLGIEDYAFNKCTSLVSVELPEQVQTVGSRTFYGCTALRSVLIPKSVTRIKNDAFILCENLSCIYYTGTKSEWENISIETQDAKFSEIPIEYNAEYSRDNVSQKLTVDEFVFVDNAAEIELTGTYTSDSPSMRTDTESIVWKSSDSSVATAAALTPVFDTSGAKATIYLKVCTYKAGDAVLTAYLCDKELAQIRVAVPISFKFDTDWCEVDLGDEAKLTGRIKLANENEELRSYICENLKCKTVTLEGAKDVRSNVEISAVENVGNDEIEFEVSVSQCSTQKFNVCVEIGNLSALAEVNFYERSPYFTDVDKDGWHSTDNVNCFSHTSTDFGVSNSQRPYNTSEKYWSILAQEEDYNEILAYSENKWGGACAGLSTSIISFFDGILKPSDIGTEGKTYWYFGSPSTNTELRDVIMFYQLLAASRKPTRLTINPKRSFAYAVGWAGMALTEQGMTNEGFWRKLYRECADNIYSFESGKRKVRPLLFGYKYITGADKKPDGHQIIIYDYDYDYEESRMYFSFYDPNNQKFDDIVVDTNDYSFEFTDGNGHDISQIWVDLEFYSVADTIDFCNAIKNNADTVLMSEEARNTKFMIEYGKPFVLTNAENESLYFDGSTYSGDMEVIDFSYISSSDSLKNRFIINSSDKFVVECADNNCDFSLETDGEYYKIESENSGKVTFTGSNVAVDGENVKANIWTLDSTKQSQMLFMSLTAAESFGVSKIDGRISVNSDSALKDVNISFLDGNDRRTNSLPDNTEIIVSAEEKDSHNSVSFDVKNKCAEIISDKEYKNACVFVGCYEDGKLVKVYSETADLNNGFTSVEFDEFAEPKKGEYDLIRTFVWESAVNMKPICPAKAQSTEFVDYDADTEYAEIQSDKSYTGVEVIAATYKENKLVDVKKTDTAINAGFNRVKLEKPNCVNADELRVFVWGANMIPLFDTFSRNLD